MSKELFSKTAASQKKTTSDYKASQGNQPENLVSRESGSQQEVRAQTREEKKAEIDDLRVRMLKYGYYFDNGVRHIHTKESWEATQKANEDAEQDKMNKGIFFIFIFFIGIILIAVLMR